MKIRADAADDGRYAGYAGVLFHALNPEDRPCRQSTVLACTAHRTSSMDSTNQQFCSLRAIDAYKIIKKLDTFQFDITSG